MDVITMNEGKNYTLKVQGRVDTITAPDLEKAIASIMEDADKIVLDLEKLEYVSSSGLRVFLSTHKMMMAKGGLTITNVNESVMEVFDITGFSSALTIEK